MSNPSEKKSFVDNTKIGEQSAMQPLSGVGAVTQSGAVNGHGGFVIAPTSDKPSKNSAA